MAVRIFTCVVHPDGEFAHLRRCVHNWVLFTGSDTPIDAGMVRVRVLADMLFRVYHRA